MGVIGGRCWTREVQLDAVEERPLIQDPAGELWPVVGADRRRQAALADQPVEHLHDVEGAEAGARLYGQALTAVTVDDRQDLRYGRPSNSRSDMKSIAHVWFGMLISVRSPR